LGVESMAYCHWAQADPLIRDLRIRKSVALRCLFPRFSRSRLQINIQYTYYVGVVGCSLTWTPGPVLQETWSAKKEHGTADGRTTGPNALAARLVWRGKGRQSCAHAALTCRIWRRSLPPVNPVLSSRACNPLKHGVGVSASGA
jgi:hypothetical protein